MSDETEQPSRGLREATPARITAEASLRESEARFRFIIDMSPGLIWVTDTGKLCTWFNKTWLAFTGRSIHQELGHGWMASVFPDDLAVCRQIVDAHFDAREPFSVEYRLRRHDGEYRWVLSIGQPRFDKHGEFKGYVGTCLDITGRKRAEMERTQFQTFFNLSLDMMCIASTDGYFQKINPAFKRVLGYSEEELLARPLVDFLVAEDRLTALRNVAMLIQGSGNSRIENRFRCKDGTVRLLSWGIFPDPDGRTIYATAHDVTEQRATEEQLNKLWLAVEQTSQGIVITDLSGRIEYINEAFSKINGYSAEEMLGRNPRMFKSGQTPATVYAELWATLNRGEIWQGEFINARKDGAVYIESARISPVRQPDGQITHYLAIKEDITEYKRAADSIRESKILLQDVIDATPDWIYVKDREHRFALVNEACAKAHHQTPSSMIGRPDSDFIPSSVRFGEQDADLEGVHDDDERVFAGETIHKPYDRMFFDNGDVRVFDTVKRPMFDSAQRVSGNLCYRRDITERFNKDQEQQLLERQLRQAQKMELIGHLTGGIAHDFNNILSAVFGYAELIQMAPDVVRNPPLALYVQEILQAGIRAKELVAQLLTFSHRREAATQAIDVTSIIQEVTKLLRSTMPTSISIDCVIADALPEVLISPVQLHQIVMNLGVNARDAMEESGMVRIKAEQVTLEGTQSCASCHTNYSGTYLMISVRDSGAGIQPEHLLRIFDPFFTTKEVGRGSGLGLSVLHGIIHSANGHIEVRTVQNQGTEFRVYLPPHSSEVSPTPVDTKKDSGHSLIRGRVMVVDDEASIVGFMTVLLENLGCQVTGLTSSTKALQMFQNDPGCVDLVITDQTMPELTGVELARGMLACRPDIPIILSTGYSNVIDDEAVRTAGIRRFLMKPVPARVLADVVAEYLTVKTPDRADP